MAKSKKKTGKIKPPKTPTFKKKKKRKRPKTDMPMAIQDLSADIKDAAKYLTPKEVRYIVDSYYVIQKQRKALDNQRAALEEKGEPNRMITWFTCQTLAIEDHIKVAMDIYSDTKEIGRWAKSIVGIGPVLSSGLIANIDITKVSTVGQIWSYAGLNPTVKWERGHKRPWNASLKILCWKIGDSFCKFKNNKGQYYGSLYDQRKAYEVERNENGELSEQAEWKLKHFNIKKDTTAYKFYKKGLLPPKHVDQRAKRWVTKIFLSHYFDKAYRIEYGKPPPKPFAIEHLGHVDYIPPPD